MLYKALAVSIALTLAGCSATMPTKSSHWKYEGAEGPENWAELSPEYSACAGSNQSPINLTGFIESELSAIAFSYASGGSSIVNNGHTVQVNYDAGSSMEIDGKVFNLLQFHFHAPSENHINGKSYPMETHLVHADADGNLAVVALMFEEGAENEGLDGVWNHMPGLENEHQTLPLPHAVSVDSFLPENRDYYRFDGSLTTPPCSEGVLWLVLKNPESASAEQISAFTSKLEMANNRPIQKINARAVLK